VWTNLWLSRFSLPFSWGWGGNGIELEALCLLGSPSTEPPCSPFWFIFIYLFLAVLGFQLRAFTLSRSSPFFVMGVF
jgi:hypothetical protein